VRCWLVCASGLALALLPALAPRQPFAQVTDTGRAEVQCDESGGPCRADVAAYIGWRVFHSHCARCHAADARGSTYAPDLTVRVARMSMQQFYAALDRGYLGPDSPLPPHGRNPDVARYYSELWRYLSARARGELPPGPLEPLPETEASVPR
jgi:cytochrome c5